MPSTTRSKAAKAAKAKKAKEAKSKKGKKRSSSKKKASTPRNPPYIRMVFEAISHTRHAGKGVSRAKIANYIKDNYDNIAEGSQFNACLRRALNDGLDRGVLVHGETTQRYKVTDLGRKERAEENTSKKYDAEEEEKKRKKQERLKKKKKKETKKAPAKKKKKTASKTKKSTKKKTTSKKGSKRRSRR